VETGKNRAPILIIEDSEADFLAIRRALRQAGASPPLRRFETGPLALAYLFREGEHADPADSPRPGTILLDLDLPGMNGREVLSRIKGHPELRRIPVIVMTGNPAVAEVDRCYGLGANSFIRKPSDPESFFAAFRGFTDFWFGAASLPMGETESPGGG
jgi:CheY-like chemotaxis protein